MGKESEMQIGRGGTIRHRGQADSNIDDEDDSSGVGNLVTLMLIMKALANFHQFMTTSKDTLELVLQWILTRITESPLENPKHQRATMKRNTLVEAQNPMKKT